MLSANLGYSGASFIQLSGMDGCISHVSLASGSCPCWSQLVPVPLCTDGYKHTEGGKSVPTCPPVLENMV